MKNNVETFLTSDEVKFDHLGRVIIESEVLLEEIKGAMSGFGGEFVPNDVGCGNSNCAC